MGRAGVVSNAAAPKNAFLLERALGNIRWRIEFKRAVEPNSATEVALMVARRFGDAVSRGVGFRCTSIPVVQRPTQLPKYLLMLFSRNEQAHWDFADQASIAYVEWLHHCDSEDYRANVQRREEYGLQEMFPEPEPSRDDIDRRITEEAARYLPEHLSSLLRQRSGVRLIDAIEDAYGDLLGRARVTHLRAALRNLYRSGQIGDDSKGDYWTRSIHWIGPID
jgi:hypothetical protein